MGEKEYTIRDISNAICKEIGEDHRAKIDKALKDHFKQWFFTMWHWDDIRHKALDKLEIHDSLDDYERNKIRENILTDKQLEDVETFILRHHDASIGINWDVIDFALDEVVKKTS